MYLLTLSGVSGEISSEFGYEAIYAAGGAFQLLAILYAIFFVKESKEIRAYKNIDASESNTSTNSSEKPATKDIEAKSNDTDSEKASCCSIFR